MTVRVQRDGAVLAVTIDRADALNAIDFPTMDALDDAITEVEDDRSLRVVILTGAGDRAFVSGGDLQKFASLNDEAGVTKMATRMRDLLARLESLDAWVVAAINGAAYGGGCETLLACDFRVCAEEAVFGFTQAKFAVPPGWGALTRLVELVGRATAIDWLAHARIVDSATALREGLVHQVVERAELTDRVLERAAQLARHERPLIGALKRGGLRAARTAAIEEELDAFVDCWLSDAHTTAIEEFLARSRATS